MEQQTKTATATVTATETVTIGKAEYEALLASRENLQSQVDWLTEQMRLLQKKQFGSSSEKRMDLNFPEQLSIFNEAEFTDDTAAALDGAANAAADDAADKTTVKAHTRRKSGSVEDVVPEGTPVEIIEHRLSEEERICKECGADGRIIPVPGSISADCGLAWCAKNESEDALLELMVLHGITPQGIYHCLV